MKLHINLSWKKCYFCFLVEFLFCWPMKKALISQRGQEKCNWGILISIVFNGGSRPEGPNYSCVCLLGARWWLSQQQGTMLWAATKRVVDFLAPEVVSVSSPSPPSSSFSSSSSNFCLLFWIKEHQWIGFNKHQ